VKGVVRQLEAGPGDAVQRSSDREGCVMGGSGWLQGGVGWGGHGGGPV
jgi:hypothetical protein